MPDTSPASITDGSGAHTFWIGSDDAIWESSPNGTTTDIGGQPAVGSGVSAIVDMAGEDVVYYIASDGSLHQLVYSSGVWANNTIVVAGSVSTTSTPTPLNDSSGHEDIYYISSGATGYVYDLVWYGGATWYDYDLGQTAWQGGTPTNVDGTASAQPSAISDASGDVDIFYTATDRSIHELSWFGGTSWTVSDIPSALAQNSNPSAGIYAGDVSVYAVGTDNNIYQLLDINGNWAAYQLATGGEVSADSSPTVVNDPYGDESVYFVAAEPLTPGNTTEFQRTAYQLAYIGTGTWYGASVSAAAVSSGPPAGVAPETNVAVTTDSLPAQHLFYIGTDGVPHDLSYSWTDSEWTVGAAVTSLGTSGCESHSFYYPTATGSCISSSTTGYSCSEVGAGYAATHVLSGGGAGQDDLSPVPDAGDYCNYYRAGSVVVPTPSLLVTPSPGDLSAYTGLSVPSPYSDYQETDNTSQDGLPSSTCQANGDTWGIWLNNSDQAPNGLGCDDSDCSGGMQHSVSFGPDYGTIDKPWDTSQFGASPALFVSDTLDGVAWTSGDASTWTPEDESGYLCVNLVDIQAASGDPVIETCLTQWLGIGDGTAGVTPAALDLTGCDGALPDGRRFFQDWSDNVPWSAGATEPRYWTTLPSSSGTVADAQGGARSFIAEITVQNLQSMIQDINDQDACTTHSAESYLLPLDPNDWAIYSVENGFEANDSGPVHVGGNLSGLAVWTSY